MTYIWIERDDSDGVVSQPHGQKPGPLFSRGNTGQGHAHHVGGHVLSFCVLVQLSSLKTEMGKMQIKMEGMEIWSSI